MSIIRNFIDKISKTRLKVAVVGDIMVDQYYQVNVDRVSPEAPILILNSKTLVPTLECAGGASNVACMFNDFTNVDISLYGICNKQTRSVLKRKRFKVINKDNTGEVPLKKRYYKGDHPIFRWDVEPELYDLQAEQLTKIKEDLCKDFINQTYDIVILSDYNKGFFTSKYDKGIWLYGGSTTVVDPKKAPASDWEGCSIIKPNEKEAKDITGYSFWKDQCDYLIHETSCRTVVITMGGDSVVGKHQDGYFTYKPKKKVGVVSVVGAGDCFVAFFSMAHALGFSIEECVDVAYHSGAIYVERKYNEPVSKNDLLKSDGSTEYKIVDTETLSKRNFPITIVNGSMDLSGGKHLDYIQYAKSLGNKLVVALNTDESISKRKGPTRPIVPLEERMKVVSGLESVDYVISFNEDTPCELYRKLKPEIICKGGDYRDKIPSELEEFKQIVFSPMFEGLSTSEKINKIKTS